MLSQNSIEENSIEENRVEENSIDKKGKVDNFIDIYSRECPMLPQIKKVTDKRKKAIATFLKTYTLEDWEETCKITGGCDFLLRQG